LKGKFVHVINSQLTTHYER